VIFIYGADQFFEAMNSLSGLRGQVSGLAEVKTYV
jgi:hypothetical protein